MNDDPRNSAPKTRGSPFTAGKAKGARHKATLAAESLLDGEAEKLTRTAIERALAGDGVALRLCLERLIPPRKDRPIRIDLPSHQERGGPKAASTAPFSTVKMVDDSYLPPMN
jgi:hypothetical protein